MPIYLILPTGPFWIAFVLSILMLLMTRTKALDALEAPIDVEEVEEETLSRAPRH